MRCWCLSVGGKDTPSPREVWLHRPKEDQLSWVKGVFAGQWPVLKLGILVAHPQINSRALGHITQAPCHFFQGWLPRELFSGAWGLGPAPPTALYSHSSEAGESGLTRLPELSQESIQSALQLPWKSILCKRPATAPWDRQSLGAGGFLGLASHL